ncbi:MAG TPA: universal stress protein [Pyrinomonadaceae bacterium]|nr:universal stress protein [Pyrinomonadaceae bacterium]
MKILLALDGSACSDAALAEVAARPWPAGSQFRVLTAYELPLMPTPEAWAISPDYCDRLTEAVREQAQKISENASVILSKAFGESVAVTSRIVVGSPKSAILEEAESWDADHIVVGSHGYGTWERFLLGSVSQAVVSHAKCSVEVVRSRNDQDKKIRVA